MDVGGGVSQHARNLESLHKNNRANPATSSSCAGFTEQHKQEGAL